MADEEALEALILRIQAAERRIAEFEKKKGVQQKLSSVNPEALVKRDLLRRSVFSGRFFTVPSNYYDWSLDERAAFLGGSAEQLCKSIIFENTVCELNTCTDKTNSKYYLVIVQYVAKINTTTLRNFIHSLRPHNERLSKNSYNFQLASEEVSLELSGFGHNAICPFGMRVPNIPVIVCSRCLEVQPPVLFLGGGVVYVKLRVATNDLVKSLDAFVGLVTDPR